MSAESKTLPGHPLTDVGKQGRAIYYDFLSRCWAWKGEGSEYACNRVAVHRLGLCEEHRDEILHGKS